MEPYALSLCGAEPPDRHRPRYDGSLPPGRRPLALGGRAMTRIKATGANLLASQALRRRVQADGSLQVQETIRVRFEDKTSRGLARDIDTYYQGADGEKHRIRIAVQRVTRDGKRDTFEESPISG